MGIPTPGQKPAEALHGRFVGWLNNPRDVMDLRRVRTSDSINADIARMRKEAGIDEAIEGVKTDMAAHAKAAAELDAQMPDRARLEELRSRLPGTDDATINAERTRLTEAQEVNAKKMENTQIALKDAEKELARLLKKKRVTKKNLKQHKKDIQSARGKISGNTRSKEGWEYTEADLKQRLSDLEEYVALSTKEASVRAAKEGLLTDGHTASYINLQERLAALQANNGVVGGRDVDWSIDNVLKQAGIENAFKQSGITHLLAVSGSNVTYIILATKFLFEKIVRQKFFELYNNIYYRFVCLSVWCKPFGSASWGNGNCFDYGRHFITQTGYNFYGCYYSVFYTLI
jgi:hypothetical protein